MILTSGSDVRLDEILMARERRVACRQQAQKTYGSPTLTLSIVMPGPVKDCPLSRKLAEVARAEVQNCFKAFSWPVHVFWSKDSPTGPETIYAVEADALALKRAMVDLEDSHPLGRLWDLDVHYADGAGISRQDLQRPPRRCLICDEIAYACARSQAHTSGDLIKAMEVKLETWLSLA